jgi:hypothetical protein
MPDVVTDTHGLIWYLEDSPLPGSFPFPHLPAS